MEEHTYIDVRIRQETELTMTTDSIDNGDRKD